MTIDELAKRSDQEIAQLHGRIDAVRTTQAETLQRQTQNFYNFTDPMKESIHDLKRTIEGLKLRIESLEKHPPVIPL